MDWIKNSFIELGFTLLLMVVVGILIHIQKARFDSKRDPEHYVMKFPGVATAGVFGAFILLCYGAAASFRLIPQDEYRGMLGFISCSVLSLGFGIILLYVLKWKIVVAYDSVTAYSLFKKVRTVKFSDISIKKKFNDEGLSIYVKCEKIFSLRESTIGYEAFCERLRELGKMS